jgi:LCP family protein required for cell wall assembly
MSKSRNLVLPPLVEDAATAQVPSADSRLHEPKLAPEQELSFWRLFLKATGLAIFFAVVMLLITAIAIAGYAYTQLRQFSQVSGVSLSQLRTMAETGWQTSPQQTQGRKNILLLGTDTLANRGNVPPLTDTMMLVSVDLTTGTIYSLSFPRDIWSSEYKTKINSLYSYGMTRYPEQPEQFPREVIEQLTGVPIHHTVVLTMDTVAKLIDTVGGVQVAVAVGFTDTEFPRSDVAITTERDPAKLYETITFTQGSELMQGERALKYMRSRHSEGDVGTDISRGQRQQAVIDALMKKVLDPQVLTNPTLAGELYKLYAESFGSVFPLSEIVATGKQLYPHKSSITQKPHTLSIYPADPQGVLNNPPIAKYKTWVYEIRDLEKFKQEVQKDLELVPAQKQ